MPTPTSPGQINGLGGTYLNDNALFLKQFAGEVLTTFERVNVMKDKHMTRAISQGKSASFPVSGQTGAGYHVPGTTLTGTQSVLHNERIINIDDFLVSDIFVAQVDELKNHYDVRSIYTTEMGRALAKAYDQKVQQVVALAARSASPITGNPGGSVLVNAAAATDGIQLAGTIFSGAQTFDEKDVPEDDRYVNVKPAQYYLLAQTTDVINKDWGGSGVYAEGEVLKVAGIHIVKSNNVPTGVIAAVPGENNTYAGTFTNTVAVMYQKGAVGTVSLMDLSTSMTDPNGDYYTQNLGTLIHAKYLQGHGVLRAECAIEIATA